MKQNCNHIKNTMHSENGQSRFIEPENTMKEFIEFSSSEAALSSSYFFFCSCSHLKWFFFLLWSQGFTLNVTLWLSWFDWKCRKKKGVGFAVMFSMRKTRGRDTTFELWIWKIDFLPLTMRLFSQIMTVSFIWKKNPLLNYFIWYIYIYANSSLI